MQKSFCDVHVDEEEKYLCTHPSCIKEKENKLLCVQCFDKHAADRTEFHQKVSYYILLEKANTNKEAFTKLQESNIERIQSIFEESKKQLNQLVEKIKIWQINQLKLLENFTGTQVKKFQEEISKANAHYKLDQLDNQIYFYLLDYPEQKRLSEESFKNTQRFISQKMKDCQQLIELLTQKNWNLQNIFQTSQGQYCLPKTIQQDIVFDICKEHREKKNQLFINQYSWRSEKIGQLSCIKCLIKQNKNADIASIRNVSDLIKEENEKIAKQKEELLNFQQNLTTLVDQNLVLIQKKQKEYYDYFESFKTKIQCIENEAIQKLMVTPKCDFILGEIDYNKLFLTSADIQRQFQNQMKSVEDKIQPISIMLEKPVDLFHQIQLEKKNNQQTTEISQLKTVNQQLIGQISQIKTVNQQQISQIQTANYYQLNGYVSQMQTTCNQINGYISQFQTTCNFFSELFAKLTCDHYSLLDRKKNIEIQEKIQQLTYQISQISTTINESTKKISQMYNANHQQPGMQQLTGTTQIIIPVPVYAPPPVSGYVPAFNQNQPYYQKSQTNNQQGYLVQQNNCKNFQNQPYK